MVGVAEGLFWDVLCHSFSRLVDGLTRFVQPRTRYGVAQLGATEPESLAKAILLLAQVSNGGIESCTLSGGIDCGWLGAVANFVFDLSVSVQQADGVVPYRSETGRRLWNGDSQVTILQSEGSSSNADIMQKSFHFQAGEASFERALSMQMSRNSKCVLISLASLRTRLELREKIF
jgi:hypothetical protein